MTCFLHEKEKIAQALKEADYLYREYGEREILSWDVLDMGMTKEYLYEEWRRAGRMETTVPCFDGCRRCGVCDE